MPGEAVGAELDTDVETTDEGEPIITVTASRSGEAIEDLPVAVSVLEGPALERQLQQSSDILRALDFTVPGLNLSAGGRSQCLARVRGRVPAFQINGVPAN